jgi:hypothetical protein
MFRRSTPVLLAPLAIIACLGVFVTSASAETTGPVWKILAVSTPTNFRPGDQTGSDAILVTATNVGGASTGCTQAEVLADKEYAEKVAKGEAEKKPLPCPEGSPVVSPVTITDSLPAGLTLAPETTEEGRQILPIFGNNAYHNPIGDDGSGNSEPDGPPFGLSCTPSPTAPSCTTSERIDPGDTLVVTIRVDVKSEAALRLLPTSCEVPAAAVSCLANDASVAGGGAVRASVGGAGGSPIVISSALPEYGVAKGGLLAATSTDQAGAHPNVTSEFFLNTINPKGESHGENCDVTTGAAGCVLKSETPAPSKDDRFDLPPGLVGTTVGMPRCTMAEVVDSANCPRDTMVGTATLIVYNAHGQRIVMTIPVFNIAPAPGEPAAFAFNALYFPVRLDTSVLSDGKYNVRVTGPDLTQGASDYMTSITIWGVPAEHNGPGPDAAAVTLLGYGFLNTPGELPQVTFGGPGVEEYTSGAVPIKAVYEKRVPLLTNPSQCSESLTGVFETDSWEAPGEFGGPGTVTTPMGTATGCGQLSFKPTVSMLPDTLEAGAPAGYAFNLNVPQNTEAGSLATPDVKRTSVTLPAGTVISPSAADGLGDCSSEQFALKSGVPGSCPRDSQVGTVSIKTPALEERLNGDVFLGTPECDPCTPADAAGGKMIRLFVQVVGEGEDGIIVKLEGTGQINQQTGQITTTFNNTPQLPFSEFQLKLQGGERATLSNPRTCGGVHTTADLTPWSTPFTPDASPEYPFDIDENCFGPQFNPSFSASTTSVRAGEFTPFTLSFGRSDSDEFLNGLQVQMPPGLLGMLSKVSLCGEPQASAGTCGPASLIGEANVETGPGADPFLVTGGKVYLTGPYKGAPYGLSIVVPAVAGPYTLSGTTGNGTVVNRSAISVNPETSALTVTADPLPTELDGIPLQLRLVTVSINRPEFTFNPTNCNNPTVGGTLTSTEAASVSKSSPLQILDCAKLAFKPKLTVASNAHTSKADGASLRFKIAYPAGSVGSESWLKAMKFDIPKQLPARLTTLQKSCLAATFEANPARCPVASVIGAAVVHTPLLPVVVSGPVYFVSHGGAKFPEVVIVLQGDGVTVDLHGETFISRAGVTSATFRAVPDVPFESAEVLVPTGPYSEFAANGNLCTEKLTMPTSFTGQNGAEIKQTTKIGVTGCPKAKKAAKKKKTKKKGKKASRARKSSYGQGGRS